MDERDKARDPPEQAAEARDQGELSYGHSEEDWPDQLREPYEPILDELALLHSQDTGHRWHGWRRLTAQEGYYAACSCGWRSTQTGSVSPMLRQVKEHLDAVWAIRGGRPSEMRPDQRARELDAAVDRQQQRLSHALGRSTDLLSASEEQADRLLAALEDAAAAIAPKSARTTASARRAETLRHGIERARELRNGIVVAAGALAAMAEEIALVSQDLKTRHPRTPAEHRHLAGEARASAGGATLTRAATAEQARRQDLLDQVVNQLFQAGLSMHSAADLPHDAAVQRIAAALEHLDDTIHDIRDHVLALSRDGPASPPPAR